KLLHNALQGSPEDLSTEEWHVYEKFNEINARQLSGGWDVIIVHDPQPLAVRRLVAEKAKHWVWRCHIDLSTPNETTLNRLVPLIEEYDGSVYHLDRYVPAGWQFFNSTLEYAAGDPDIKILNNLNQVGSIEVNAFQSQAEVVIQKSTREGFGLTVSEALWKARPFIGGDVGGIPLQVQDG